MDRGARQVCAYEHLFQKQAQSLESILHAVYWIAREEATYRSEFRDDRKAYLKDQSYRQPFQTFVINGGRGTGKTTLLLTVHHLLEHMGAGHEAPSVGRTRKVLETISQKINDAIHPEESKRIDLLASHGREGQTALVLPLLYPCEMEHAESTMENIFAQIDEILRPKTEREHEDKKREKLIGTLRHDISVGWAFSRGIGVDTLSRDSLDYKDFVGRRAEQATIGYMRVEKWRRYVNDLLEYFHRELLVICIDDTDLDATLSEDILHAIRIYLSHPRIVVLLAADMKALEKRLEMVFVQKLGRPLKGLPKELAGVGKEWFKFQKTELRNYIHKIMPPGQCWNVGFSKEDLDGLFRHLAGRTDEKGSLSWTEFLQGKASACLEQIDLDPKSHRREERKRQMAERQLGAEAQEWWLFSKRAPVILLCLSVREMIYCIQEIVAAEQGIKEILEKLAPECPSFSMLRYMLEDLRIESVEQLLEEVSANFGSEYGTLAMELRIIQEESESGVEVSHRVLGDSPTFRLLEWFADLETLTVLRGIGENSYERSQQLFQRLLPYHQGAHAPSDLSQRMRQLSQGNVGISTFFDWAPIPRNCIYYHEVVSLMPGLIERSRVWPEWLNLSWEYHWNNEVPAQVWDQQKTDDLACRVAGDPDHQIAREDWILRGIGKYWTGLVRSDPAFELKLFRPLWLLMKLVDRGKPWTRKTFMNDLRKFDELKPKERTADGDFGKFLTKCQEAVKRLEYFRYETSWLLENIFIVARERRPLKSELGASGIYDTLDRLKKKGNERCRLLMAWSLVPISQSWLELGLSEHDVQCVLGLAENLSGLREDDFWGVTDLNLQLIDFSQSTRQRMRREIEGFEESLKTDIIVDKTQYVIPDTDSLASKNVADQIAVLLRISPRRASEFLSEICEPST